MSSEDTHLIPSDRAVWSLMMLVNRQTPSCCFVARLQSHTFVIFNSFHMQSATRQVGLDSSTYFQLLFPPPSLASLNLTRNRLDSNTRSQLFLRLQMWAAYFLLWERAVKNRLHGDLLNRSSSKIINWQFSRLSRISTNGVSLRSGEAEMKKIQRSRQAHFLGVSSPDSFPPDRFALHRSRAWLKSEPACRLE